MSQIVNPKDWDISPLPDSALSSDNFGMRTPKLSPDASALAREIYRRAADKKIGQKRLALAAGLNETFVRDLYDGSSKAPSAENVDKIAQALGCTVDALLHPERAIDPEQSERYAKTDEELAVLLAWRKGGEDMQEAIVSAVQGIALGPLTRFIKR